MLGTRAELAKNRRISETRERIHSQQRIEELAEHRSALYSLASGTSRESKNWRSKDAGSKVRN